MKIALLSDSHTKVEATQEALAFLRDQGASFIIHAGDLVDPQNLELLAATQMRYIAVYGNNDAHLVEYAHNYNLVQEPYYFKLADTKCKLMHLPLYLTPDAELVIFGHTHQFEVMQKSGTLYINPGEICARNKPYSECALLEIQEEAFCVDYYTKGSEDLAYRLQEHYEFKRQKHE